MEHIGEIEKRLWSGADNLRANSPFASNDEDFDFGQTMRDIHSELDELNAESVRLAATIKRNFEALGL